AGGKWIDFAALIERYRQDHKGWDEDYHVLKAFSALRNVIAHQEKEPDKHLFIPSAEAVAQIEAIRRRLEHPRKVVPMFKKTVMTVQLRDSSQDPLAIIYSHNFSQLPVYDGEHFRGLLTENGITRWLSHAAANGQTEVYLRNASVAEMLHEEE